jgi:hypothetical protein
MLMRQWLLCTKGVGMTQRQRVWQEGEDSVAQDGTRLLGGRVASWLAMHLPAVGVFLVAFLPRVLGFVGSTTIWQTRAKTFMDAVASGDWATTLQAPHPGVTTMWLAGLGRAVGSALSPGFDELPLARQSAIELIPIALVVSLCIALAYSLLARLFDRQIAAVAALLLALDPYHISLSKAVHVDALVSVFMLVSALYMWAFIRERRRRQIVLSGAFAGLALLTKTPAIFLAPYFALCVLAWQASQWLAARRASASVGHWLDKRRIRMLGSIVVLWTAALVATYWLVWPSMWTQPLKTVGVSFGGALYYRETPHENPLYYLGEPTEADPGPTFYPINMAIKMTAVSTLGFLASLALLRRPLEPNKRLAVLLGLAFVLFFAIQMTLGEKKFTRYALPALQFVTILAAVGWVSLLRWATRGRSWLLSLSLLAVVAGQFAVSVPRHPYYGTHYNYLLGGPRVILGRGIVPGQEKGEGLEIAADYLNHLPMSKLLVVGAQSSGGFYFYFQGKTVPLTDDRPDYILFTRSELLRSVQVEEWGAVWEEYRTREPKLVVSFDGVPYVWVYKTGPVIDEAGIANQVHAQVGQDVKLLGYAFEPQQVRPGESVQLTLYWECTGQEPGDYTVFTHLVDATGETRAQKDNPPQGGMYPTYLWDPGERVQDSYQLELPPDTPAGAYRFAVGMYILQTMERLPVATAQGTSPPDQQLLLDGPQVLPQ